ncbi:MAG: hypothetical protein GX552_19250 [Chloroflexi bacterium]|nr:hypothetical protein [Chloroflexota bacterium]
MESNIPNTLPELGAIFGPTGKPPEHLTVLDIRHMGFDRRLTAGCLQGLVNRQQPRVLLVYEDPVDRFWLETYCSRYGLTSDEVNDLASLAAPFADEIDGLVIYDDEMLHSANVAQTFGSLHNLVPVSPAQAKVLESVGYRVREDFRGRWKNRLEAYRWAVRELLPHTNRHLFGSLDLDSPRNAVHQVRDYLVAKQAFTFDLSTRMRDREEVELWDEIVDTAEYPGILMGWHSGRSSESEYVTRAAAHGLSVICSFCAENLTVHNAIPAPQTYKQKPPKYWPTLQEKVYVVFTYTDGDNISVMCRFMAGQWRDSNQGKIPFTWEILPLAIHLAPGVVEQYFKQATENDYFIAGPSGFTYTYPSAHARLEDHLALTNLYGKAVDLRSMFVMDWNPRLSFRELEDPQLPERLARGIDDPIGFTHNYSGVYGRPTSTGDIPTVFAGPNGDVPYINSDVYVSGHGSDIYAALTRYAKACDWRPLFICVRARDNTEVTEVRRAIEMLDPEKFEVLRLDQFMGLLREAHAKGLYKNTSPSKKKMLTEAAKDAAAEWWKRHRAALEGLKPLLDLDAEAILERINTPNVYFPSSVVGDYVAWEAVEATFRLVRAALFQLGVYAGLRDEAVRQFTAAYAHIEDIQVAEDALSIWQEWEKQPNELEAAKALARRILALSERFVPVLAPGESN